LLGPITPQESPIANKEFLRKFGINDFPTPIDADVDRAKWENNLIRQGKLDLVEVTDFDDNVVHWRIVTDYMKKPEFADRHDQETVDLYVQHQKEHESRMTPEQKQMLGIPVAPEEMAQPQGANIPVETAEPPPGVEVPGGQPPPPPPEESTGMPVL
jgi:hypothetical protein